MYDTVKTEDGIEVWNDDELVAGPSSKEPLRDECLTDLLEDAEFTKKQIRAIQIIIGNVEYVDEREE